MRRTGSLNESNWVYAVIRWDQLLVDSEIISEAPGMKRNGLSAFKFVQDIDWDFYV